MPERIQRRRTDGWTMPDTATYVGRPTVFGNPFTTAGAARLGYVGDDATGLCVDLHLLWLAGNPWLLDVITVVGRAYDRHRVLAHVGDLEGRDLACWCRPASRCHADTLLVLAASSDPLAAAQRLAAAGKCTTRLADLSDGILGPLSVTVLRPLRHARR